MSDIPYLKCPICGNNFHQSFECDHDEYGLIGFYQKHITELEAQLKAVKDEISDCRDAWAPDRPPVDLAIFLDDLEAMLKNP